MNQFLKQSVGIDISMKSFAVAFCVIAFNQKVSVRTSKKFSNTPLGFKLFLKWISKHKLSGVPITFTMEATGVYYEQLAWFLHLERLEVSVLLPNKARKYMQGVGIKTKNDKIDAMGLGRMGAEQALDKWEPISESAYQLRSLTRENEELQEVRTRIKNQLHALKYARFNNARMVKRLKTRLKQLEQHIKQVKKDIVVLIKSDQKLKAKVDRIIPIKGLGMLTIATVIAETNGFALIRNQQQLVSYAGYDVVENQSGAHQGKTKMSKKGNRHIRRALHMPAFTAVRHHSPALSNLYHRLIGNGKLKMQAYVAVQKKLLILIYALWKNDTFHDPDFHLKAQISLKQRTEKQRSIEQAEVLYKL